jgi:hypothetical protein
MLRRFLPAQARPNMPVRMFSKVGSGDGFRLQRMTIRSRRIFENSRQARIQARNQLPLQWHHGLIIYRNCPHFD